MELSYTAVCFDLFGTLVTGDGGPIPGVRDALAMLPPERWAIVTSCGSAYAHALIQHAGLPVPRVLIAADSVTRNKPAAEPYLAGAAALNLTPTDILVVEDSRDGIASGRSAGMDVLAILAGRGLSFAREASFQVERFSDIRWQVADSGIRVTV